MILSGILEEEVKLFQDVLAEKFIDVAPGSWFGLDHDDGVEPPDHKLVGDLALSKLVEKLRVFILHWQYLSHVSDDFPKSMFFYKKAGHLINYSYSLQIDFIL